MSFEYYYEYELLRLVLKDYNDVLSEQLNFQKIKIFTPQTTIVNPNDDTKNVALNTITQNSQKQQQAFGEVAVNRSTVQTISTFDTLQEEDVGIVFKINTSQ